MNFAGKITYSVQIQSVQIQYGESYV